MPHSMFKSASRQTWFWIGAIALAFIIALLVASFLSGSSSSQTYNSDGGGIGGEFLYDSIDQARVVTSASEESYADFDASRDELAPTESYVIRTGSITMRVNSVSQSMEDLTTISASHNGYIEYSYIDQSDEYTDGYATLRVSADAFDATMNDIQGLASSVRYVSVSSDDVTEQVIDIQARLTNAQAEEASYLEVLDIATSVEDILDVRYYLSQVRETIERYEAQLEYYESVTSMATITVEMTEETSIVLDSETFRPSQAIVEAAQTVVRIAQGIVIALIWIVIVGGALLIPLYLVWRIGRRVGNAIKKSK